ncbi:MAG: protein-glutamate O-methyltransferase [Deltaproteobacteria bacterium]
MSTHLAQEASRSADLVLSRVEFQRIAQILNEVSGITLPESKENLVYSRLSKRVRQLRLPSFKKYCDFIASPEGADERQELLSALTTNVTRFFREPHHFTDLANNVIGPLKSKATSSTKLRIWSSACSTGEEPYSIAMTILDSLPRAGDMDIRVLATDIDPRVVARATAGTYAESIIEPLSSAQRTKYLTHDGAQWSVSRDVRNLIRFAELNLTNRFPMAGKFDAIFCRNVAIYFDKPTQEALWVRLVNQLGPGGRLYIGHSERITGPALDHLDLAGITAYCKKASPSQNGRK